MISRINNNISLQCSCDHPSLFWYCLLSVLQGSHSGVRTKRHSDAALASALFDVANALSHNQSSGSGSEGGKPTLEPVWFVPEKPGASVRSTPTSSSVALAQSKASCPLSMRSQVSRMHNSRALSKQAPSAPARAQAMHDQDTNPTMSFSATSGQMWPGTTPTSPSHNQHSG